MCCEIRSSMWNKVTSSCSLKAVIIIVLNYLRRPPTTITNGSAEIPSSNWKKKSSKVRFIVMMTLIINQLIFERKADCSSLNAFSQIPIRNRVHINWNTNLANMQKTSSMNPYISSSNELVLRIRGTASDTPVEWSFVLNYCYLRTSGAAKDLLKYIIKIFEIKID